MRTIEEIINDLSQPIPDEFLYTRTLSGTSLTYIAWHGAVQLLDMYAPGWSGEITDIKEIGGRLVLTYSLTIPAKDGEVVRDATGSEDVGKSGYGDPSSNAESMAFRRAASKFGLGLYLYSKKKTNSSPGPAISSATRRTSQPKPQTKRYAREVDNEEFEDINY